VNVSVITLAVISIDRFFAVLHPLRHLFTHRSAKAVMAAVWLFSILSSAPSAIVFQVILISTDDSLDEYATYSSSDPPLLASEDNEAMSGGASNDVRSTSDEEEGLTKPYCYPMYPKVAVVDLGQVYRLYLALVQYFIPLFIISYAYARIIHRIWLSKAPGAPMDERDQRLHKNKKKVSHIYTPLSQLRGHIYTPLSQLRGHIYTSLSQLRGHNYIHLIVSTTRPYIHLIVSTTRS